MNASSHREKRRNNIFLDYHTNYITSLFSSFSLFYDDQKCYFFFSFYPPISIRRREKSRCHDGAWCCWGGTTTHPSDSFFLKSRWRANWKELHSDWNFIFRLLLSFFFIRKKKSLDVISPLPIKHIFRYRITSLHLWRYRLLRSTQVKWESNTWIPLAAGACAPVLYYLKKTKKFLITSNSVVCKSFAPLDYFPL
jgi:hypothetical protein